LLHGVSSQEARLLLVDDIDAAARRIQLGQRPSPTVLDPASWKALQRCLDYRDTQQTNNPHVIVTRGAKARMVPASTAYLSHVLDAVGVAPTYLRSTRLLDLVGTMDPKIVAAAFGMDPQAALHYLADAVDPTRLPGR
jgi:hypothetical protein